MKLINKIILSLRSKFHRTNFIDNKVIIEKSVSVTGSKLNNHTHIENNSKIIFSKFIGNIRIAESNEIISSEISGNVKVGARCQIVKCKLVGHILIGNNSSLYGPNIDIYTGKQKVSIGNFCSIARNVSIQSYNHNKNKLTTYFIGQNIFKETWDDETVSNGDIAIDNDVWIGSHCVILGGVKISNGAIIAANSVISKDVPPFAIVAGSPAKVIGYRFSQEKIDFLQKLAWWEWPIDKIKVNKQLFQVDFKEVKELSSIKIE